MFSAITNVGKTLWHYVKTTTIRFIEDDGPDLAASIAYFTIFSLPPLLVLVTLIASAIFSPEDVQGRIETEISDLVGKNGVEFVRTTVTAAGERTAGGGVGAVFGIIVLAVGATGAFIELQYALNKVWGVKPDPNARIVKEFLLKRVLSLGMIVGLSFLLLVSLVISAAISWLGDMLQQSVPWISEEALWALDFVVSFTTIAFLFGAIFKILPDAKLDWGDVRAGAIVTTILFLIGKFLIGFYLSKSDITTIYGTAGSFALILAWIYYSAIIVLLGAEFTQVWARRHGNRIRPESGAMRVESEEVVIEKAESQ